MKKLSSNNLILMESLIILLSMIIYYMNPDFLINFIFIGLICTLFIFRNSSIRHMYFGFFFLLLSLIGSVLEFNSFVFITSGLALSLFILGVLNMILFYE